MLWLVTPVVIIQSACTKEKQFQNIPRPPSFPPSLISFLPSSLPPSLPLSLPPSLPSSLPPFLGLSIYFDCMPHFVPWLFKWIVKCRVQRKSFLQLAIRASWSSHLLAQTLFQLAPKIFWWTELISQFFCKLNSSKYFPCRSGKLRTEFTSPIVKSAGPRLSDITFFAHCKWH